MTEAEKQALSGVCGQPDGNQALPGGNRALPGGNRELPIGIFDSGLGGLTALREVQRLLPHEDIVYFGDTGRVPYGSRSHETVCRYAEQDMRFLLSRNVKAVAVACGTVSANALPQLQAHFSVPVIGVIDPAVKRALSETKNGVIGVIATPSTIASGAYERALHGYDPSVRVVSVPCALFVHLVENGFIGADDPIPTLTAERYLQPIRESGADVLILGCTHYPLLRPIIERLLPGVVMVDSGAEAAHALCGLLSASGLKRETDAPGRVRCYVSDEPQGFASSAARFLSVPDGKTAALPEVSRIEIEQY